KSSRGLPSREGEEQQGPPVKGGGTYFEELCNYVALYKTTRPFRKPQNGSPTQGVIGIFLVLFIKIKE
ncbi:MAG: hypothetical protein L6300_18535, partial [Syntrophaceae bacterium]|nr:hypothetical protein [Pseudomonadota bacterium]MCG2742213.1 hypothetical protein [Syntrophaceae bacterium]